MIAMHHSFFSVDAHYFMAIEPQTKIHRFTAPEAP